MPTSNTNNQALTQAEAQRAQLGIAITQTAYALNNGGGIVKGQPLVYIDDQTTVGRTGYSPLDLTIPTGFIVKGLYIDTSAPSENTGANMFMAYNAQTKQVLLGMAGTNGVGRDMPDTRSDIAYVGADQARFLATKTDLGKDISKLVPLSERGDLSFIVGGDSLSSVPAMLVPTILVEGLNGDVGKVEGLSATQFSITNVVPLGANYAASYLGLDSKLESFSDNAEIFNFTTQNNLTGYDLVTGMGGGNPGRYFVATTTGDTYSSVGSKHQMNYAFASWYNSQGGDLTQAAPIDVPPTFTHQSIASVSSQLADARLVENNWMSMSAASYAGILLSTPGETASSAEKFLTDQWGWNKGLAKVAGAGVELLIRGTSMANLPAAIGTFLTGLLGGKALGSDAQILPAFPPVAPGYIRTITTDPDSAFIGVIDQGEGQTILRLTDGSTRTTLSDGRTEIARPDGTVVFLNAEGIGVMQMGKTGALVNINADDVITLLPYSGVRVRSPEPTLGATISDYSGSSITTYAGAFSNGTFNPAASSVTLPYLDGAQFYSTDVSHNTLTSVSTATGYSVDALVNANPDLSANMSLAPGVQVKFPTTSFINLGTNNTGTATGETLFDATSAGPSGQGNYLIATHDYSVGIHYGLLGDVNTMGGNTALFNYGASDNLRSGNDNIGLNINASSGQGLKLPSTSVPLNNPIGGDYSAYGSSLNNAAAANFNLVPTDPLVLDLNGDGVRLTNYTDAPVLFDADNDGGSLEQTGWVSAQDGIVVHDLNNDGKINNMRETLSEYYNGVAGSAGVAGTKPFANGFAALKSLDSNADNQFTSADAAWSQLRVWVDANHDGQTDAGELKTFDQLGITSTNLATTAQSGEVRDGNEVLARGSFVQNGVTREAVSANFLANPAGSTISQTGSGITVTTEGTASGAAATTAFVSQNTDAGLNETLTAAALSVKNMTGGAGNDTITGDAQNNWLAGNTGADKLYGGAGDDVLLFDAFDTVVDGGDGLDVAQVMGQRGVTLNLAQSHIEIAVGGDGNDVLIGGGSTVFVRGGAGDDILIGGAANDVLSGEDGSDLIDGGAGNDLIRGHRGQDQLLGGQGDDVLDGGLEDDSLSGGAGNDVLVGGRGDDTLNGGDGIDVAQYSGSYADYRITKLRDEASGGTLFRVVHTRSGQDGADTLSNIEKLSFSDVSRVDLTMGAPMPAKDILSVNSIGQALSRTAAHLLSKQQLLANDRDWDSDTSQLSISAVLEAKGGTATLTAQGDVLFTPDATYTGVMGFKYKVQDAQGNFSQITASTGQTEPMKAAVYLQTPDLPNDPMAVEQWYLADSNVIAAWGTAAEQAAGRGYSGKGIRIGQFEPGGPYSVGPEVFDYRHPDLVANADKTWLNTLDASGNTTTPQTFSTHATMVAGVMVAARNGEGGVGVAYDASLAGNYINGTGLEVGQLSAEITNALANFKNYDVVNNSWGATANFDINVTPVGLLETGMLDAVQNGRGGLGTAIVMAGGNDREKGANTNTNALTANRAVITVGSINAPGDLGTLQQGSKPFSNPGASILVSAPGSNIDSTSRELIGDNGSTFGSAYGTTQGTSFAAPIVSGIIALMLEANPTLGYRDIQTILAMSATQFTDPNGTDWTYNTAKNWNGGGMHTSHDYGFGKVDARAAVRLAETWTERNIYANEQLKSSSSGALNAAITDGSGVLTRTLGLQAGLEVESAQVSLELDHARWGDLIIKLISPKGTESILVNRPGKAPGSAVTDLGDASSGPLSFSFNTTHVRGEDSGGNWTLQVIDAATGNAGILKNWRLDLFGAAADTQDVYVYTNEFASTAGRTSLLDTNGGRDIVNASAVSGNSTINLNNGSTSTLAGKQLTISGDIEVAFGGDGDDTLTGNAQENVLLGGRGSDVMDGGGGNDTFDGGVGNDMLTGGAGKDLFVIRKDAGSQDTIVDFSGGEGEVIALLGFTNLSYASLVKSQVGSDVRINVDEGQTLLVRNQLVGQLGQAQFQFFSSQAGLQAWQLAGQNSGNAGGATEGDDMVQGTAGDDVLSGLGGNDTLLGMGGHDKLLGGTGKDMLDGGAGNDVLVLDGDQGGVSYNTGAAGQGTRTGGAGDDRFLVAANGGGSTTVGLMGETLITSNLIYDFDVGSDKIDLSQFAWITNFSQLKVSKALSINNRFVTRVSVVENEQTVAVGLYSVEPSAVTAGNFIFAGSADATPMPVPLANTNSAAGAAPLAITDRSTPTTTLPGTQTGSTGNDTLTGTAGANLMDGLRGADSMTGRTGDDIYVIDDQGDTVIELPGGGSDFVLSSVSYTLADNVEALILTSNANLNATGNSQRNRLVGNAGTNRLDGGAEADSLLGGAGDDSYVVDDQLDSLYENFNEGTDTVESSVSWTLGSNFENLILTGTGNTNATGNDLANRLTGNAGDNILDGAQGADAMAGGAGNDTYYVDNAGDTITELVDAGIDTIYSNLNLTLADNVENAVLFGTATSLVGNALDNMLLGNGLANTLNGGAGDDTLDGSAGADTLAGGTGDDSYFVDNAGDVVTENAGEGNDTINASVNYTLGAQIENLTLAGTVALSGTGSALDNLLRGNGANNTLSGMSGNDTLDGGAGADAMAGGTGNDSYYVDAAGDAVVELAGEGTDTVMSAISFSLGANVENLRLTGVAATNATGNALNNTLTGNGANNTLDGGAGDDRYNFGLGGGQDSIVDASGTNRVVFGPGITATMITASRANGQAVLTVAPGDSVSFASTDNSHAVETFEFADGTVLGAAWLGALLNTAPVAALPLIDQQAIETQAFSYTVPAGTFADADAGDVLTWSARLSNGQALPAWLSFNAATRTLSGTPPDTAAGRVQIQLSATDQVGAAASTLLNLDITNAINGTAGNETLTGTGGADHLYGLAGDDTLDGGAGADRLVGGIGSDTYVVDSAGDVLVELALEGTDTVNTSLSYTLGDNLENLTLTGTAAISGIGNALNNKLMGNSADNILTGGAGDDILNGLGGADTMTGGSGDDVYYVTSAGDTVVELADGGTDRVTSYISYVLGADVENLFLYGTAAINGTGNALNNHLLGNTAANTLTGGTGDDVLDGGAGADAMAGGTGNDIYIVDDVGDVVAEQAGEGTDEVQTTVSYTLTPHVEKLILTGAASINGTGNALDNTLTGNAAANTLNGGAGNDILKGGKGDDTYIVDAVGDTVTENLNEGLDTVQSSISWTLSANLENLTLTGTAAINATGNALNNTLMGNSAANVLDGGSGVDTLQGGLGNDTYVVNSTTDTLTENTNEGTDTVQSSVSYTLGANLENLTLTGTAATRGTGNALNNVLTGNTGNNTLDGGAGVDTLQGGLGNDTYVVDNAGDVIVENANEGTDKVQSSVSYTLSANLENLTLTGTAALNGTGNALSNALTGNTGNNVLDGGAGVDTLRGGLGNDTYVLDNAGDVIVENANEGTDTVQSSLSYTLGTNLENLTLTGTAVINATGNALNNTLMGNSAANVLDGGSGVDTLQGGLGNDTYVVNSTTDTLTENTNEGTDTVQSSVSYTLGANLENLTLTGTTAIRGTGNALNNVLVGNSANNTLSGGAGNDSLNGGVGSDTLIGGSGNDTYTVNSGSDVVIETANEGTDKVQSSVSYTLGADLENLTLTGTTAINGTGNALNNQITGNTGNNTLDGGAGVDTLQGGLGNDTYVFGRGSGQDKMVDTDATVGNVDVLSLTSGVSMDQLWFKHMGNDLEVSIIGSTDKATVKNWYGGSQNQIEKIKTSDGKTLLNTDVEKLVQAMASFSAPASGQTTLPTNYQTTLAPVIAANWH